MQSATFHHLISMPLKHNGDCSLLGIAADFTVYVEEVYSEDAWVAQHALKLDGTMIFSQDEEGGANTAIQSPTLPPDMVKPRTCWQTMNLNFAGPRRRGLQGPDHLLDMLHPLPVQEKFALVKRLGLKIPPPLLLGLAESYVLAEAELMPGLYFVCRRIRLAIGLTQEQIDEEGLPYDYDTLALYAAHLYNPGADEELALSEALADLPGVELRRPMDCLYYENHLFVADGGDDQRPSTIHVWQVELPSRETPDEALARKLYG
jgi:hypothetical protein